MININNLALEDKMNNLLKAIEIVGGKEFIQEDFVDKNDLAEYILISTLEKGNAFFRIENKTYSIADLLGIKIDFEKYFLKNKARALEGIVFKIKKYDTSLDSRIRKYKKTNDLKEYNEIYRLISKTYRRDINVFVLKAIDNEVIGSLQLGDEEKYYGQYLTEKRKHLIDSIIRKMGIN